MPGVRGKSGGARRGAGRKANPKATIGLVDLETKESPEPEELTIGDLGKVDPLEFLEKVMLNPLTGDQLRVRAAITVAQYRHSKKGDGGKKEAKADAAKKASSGRFASAAPPKANR